jgi:uncharacterized protein
LKTALPLLLFLLGVASAIYTSDLAQRNHETIFLTTDGLTEYQQFLSGAQEHPVLVVSLLLAPGLRDRSVERYQQLQQKIDRLIAAHDDKFEFITPADLYGGPHKVEQALKREEFLAGPVRLMGDNHLSFLVTSRERETTFALLIEQIKEQFSGGPLIKLLEFAGTPYTNYLLDHYSRAIKERAFPLLMLCSLIIILLVSRNLWTALGIFLPALFAAPISLVPIKLFFGSVNMVSSIVPLMAFSITLALNFHLYFSIIRTKSFTLAWREKGRPITLMILTTSVGFGSLVVAPITVISQFGMLLAVLIPILSLYSLAWFYLCSDFLLNNALTLKRFFPLDRLIAPLVTYSLPRKWIVILMIGSSILGIWAAGRIEVITDATRYFPEDNGIKASIDSVHQRVVGIPLYDILIELPSERLTPGDIIKFDRLERKLVTLLPPQLKADQLLSANSMVKSANKVYSGLDILPSSLPAYQLLWGRLKEGIRGSYPINDHYKMSLLGVPVNFADYHQGLEIVRNYLDRQGISYQINGIYYNLMISQKAMITILTQSFLIALLVVGLIASLYLRKASLFFIFLIVNIGPAFLALFVSYLLNLSLNIATVMTYSIAMGMIVDSSFHMLHALRSGGHRGFEYYLTTTILPIVSSSLLLIGSVILLGANQFLPIRQFGINLGIILFFGLLFDLYILPSLLLGHNRIKESVSES